MIVSGYFFIYEDRLNTPYFVDRYAFFFLVKLTR